MSLFNLLGTSLRFFKIIFNVHHEILNANGHFLGGHPSKH
jgi:hypothetical protein